MIAPSLSTFVEKIRAKNRISFGDVQRLQRDVLADGLTSRAEAELFIGLDRTIAMADPAWTGYLVRAVVDFVVWGERPTGVVEESTARWLIETLAGPEGHAPTRTARPIAREIALEAHAFANEALAALAELGRAPSRLSRCRIVSPSQTQLAA